MYPFISRIQNRLFIKLNKDIYAKGIVGKAAEENKSAVLSIKSRGGYYLVELNNNNSGDYFDFLNYLIYSSRNK